MVKLSLIKLSLIKLVLVLARGTVYLVPVTPLFPELIGGNTVRYTLHEWNWTGRGWLVRRTRRVVLTARAPRERMPNLASVSQREFLCRARCILFFRSTHTRSIPIVPCKVAVAVAAVSCTNLSRSRFWCLLFAMAFPRGRRCSASFASTAHRRGTSPTCPRPYKCSTCAAQPDIIHTQQG